MNLFKSTLVTVAGAATLAISTFSAIAPAHAETLIINPGVINICDIQPWKCLAPLPVPPAPPAPAPGLSKNEKLALGIAGGVLAGAVLLNAANKAKQNAAIPVNEGNYQSHVAWCSGKYKSYDIGTNSWQPKGGGGRKLCASPYL